MKEADLHKVYIFESLFSHAPIGLCFLDASLRYVYINDWLAQMNGHPVSAHLGRQVKEVLPDFPDSVVAVCEKVVRSGTALVGHEFQAVPPGRSHLVDLRLSFLPVRDHAGTVLGVAAFVEDLSVQKGAERALEQSRDRLELAQEAAKVGTFEWNLLTNEVNWSESEEALYGLPAGGFKGHYDQWLQYVLPEDRPTAEEALRQAIEQKQVLDVRYRIKRTDGDIRWIAARGRVFSDASGRPLRMLGLNQDITEEQLREERLRHVVQELETSRGQLQEKIADLERFTEVVVGRELKMMELEKEIARLQEENTALKSRTEGKRVYPR